MAGLDARRLRLHDLSFDHAADCAGIPCPADGGDRGLHLDPVDAARRRHRLGLARRPGRAQDAADDLDRLVFGLQPLCRVFAGILVLVFVPRAARHRHGCRMAGRRGIGDGNLAAALARVYGERAAIVMGPRRAAVERRLRAALHLDRLARPADHGRDPGAAARLHSNLRQGACGLAREPPAAAHPAARGPPAAAQHLQARHDREHADDLLVDGERVCRRLFDHRAVSDLFATGPASEPGAWWRCRS